MIYIMQQVSGLPAKFIVLHFLSKDTHGVRLTPVDSPQLLTQHEQNQQNLSLLSVAQQPQLFYLILEEWLSQKLLQAAQKAQTPVVIMHSQPRKIASQIKGQHTKTYTDTRLTVSAAQQRVYQFLSNLPKLNAASNVNLITQYAYVPAKKYYSLLKLEYLFQKLEKFYNISPITAQYYLNNLRPQISERINPFTVLEALTTYPYNKTINYYQNYLKYRSIHELLKMIKKGLFILFLAKSGHSAQVIAKQTQSNPFYISNLLRNIPYQKMKAQNLQKSLETILNIEAGVRGGKLPDLEEAFFTGLIKIQALLKTH